MLTFRRTLGLALFLILEAGFVKAFVLPALASSTSRVSSRLQAGINGVAAFDPSFTLDPKAQALLDAHLEHQDVLNLVKTEAKCTSAEYTGHLFQPMPYTLECPYGMPKSFERFRNNPDYVICNVPPVIMFKSKIFKPSRLCAVYSIEGLAPEERARILAKREEEEKRAAARLQQGGSDEKPEYSKWEADDLLQDTKKQWSPMGEAIHTAWHLQDGDDDDSDLDAYIV